MNQQVRKQLAVLGRRVIPFILIGKLETRLSRKLMMGRTNGNVMKKKKNHELKIYFPYRMVSLKNCINAKKY